MNIIMIHVHSKAIGKYLKIKKSLIKFDFYIYESLYTDKNFGKGSRNIMHLPNSINRLYNLLAI